VSRQTERFLGSLGLILLALAALWLVVWASVQQPQPTLQNSKGSTEQSTAANNAPSSGVTLAENRPQQESKAHQFLGKLLDPILWVTIAIACFARQQVLVYRRQAGLLERQAGVMEDQLKATHISAQAAKDSADALKLLNRQWVNFENWEGKVYLSIGTKETHLLHVRFVVVNRTTQPMDFQHVEYGPASTGNPDYPKHLLAPNEGIQEQMSIALSADYVTRYFDKTADLIIYGAAYFIDVFGQWQRQPFSVTCQIGHGEMTRFTAGWFLPKERMGPYYQPEKTGPQAKDQP
jgi:hypothetical protein